MAKSLWQLSFLFLLSMSSCQKKPALSASSDPLSAIEPPPMGALTYNDELKQELVLLEKIFTNAEPKKLREVKAALIKGEKSSDEKLSALFLAMPELVHEQNLSPNRQKWFKAKLFFIRRRFVEAAKLMDEVLEKEPNFYEAINWQARAIFFLGNPDLAEIRLNTIITKTGESSSQGLDALYLLGAISFESNDADEARIKRGIDAWSRYLRLAQVNSAMQKEIEDGLKELKDRLAGDKPGTKPKEALAGLDPFVERPAYSNDKNAILRAFAKKELLLAKELSEQLLKKAYDADIVTIKARILLQTGEMDEAAKLFAELTKKNPKYAPGFLYQGMAFMLRREPKNAISSWQKVLEINRDYAGLHNLTDRIKVAEKLATP